MHCVLIGNYGVGNFGDEALKEYFLSAFPDITWSVVSARPSGEELPRLPGGFRSLFSHWWKTLGAIRNTDAVVFGGGTLFTDVESPYACFLWWVHAVAARITGTPVLLAFQGVGPFRTSFGKMMTRNVCRHAAFLSVRDEPSANRVKSWGLNMEVIQTFDPAFIVFEAKKSLKKPKNVFVIIPRRNSGKTLFETCASVMQDHTFDSVSILMLQPDDRQEVAIAETIRQQLDSSATITPVTDATSLCAGVGEAALVVTERFHGAVAALALDVPFKTVSQREGDKLSAIAEASREECREWVRLGESALKNALVGLKARR